MLVNRVETNLFSTNEPPPEDWDSFLDPDKKESENLQRAREYLSDNSLPISYNDEEDDTLEDGKDQTEEPALLVNESGEMIVADLSQEAVANNPYVSAVSKIAPSELISKFTSSAHPRVQNAVRQTVLGLIGGLPKMAFETTTITSGQRLASLMFQLQMTGYMFKNADYRLSLQQSLGLDGPVNPTQSLLAGSANVDEEDIKDSYMGNVKGKLRIRYKKENTENEDVSDVAPDDDDGIEVDAEAYMAELRSEVSQLKGELQVTRDSKEESLRKDLLLYIRTLPEKELQSLTNTMTPEVLVAMKGLVNAVLAGVGEGEIGPDTMTEQSGEAMAQLCMWQLAIGYNLRTLEVREEMRKSLEGDSSIDGDVSPNAFG